MKTTTKLSIRILGIIMGLTLMLMLIEAAVMPWDGFRLSSKMIIGNANQYQPKH